MTKTLLIAGIANIFIALLHIAIMIIGVEAYNYFGAPIIFIHLAEQGHPFTLGIMMMLIAFCFLVAGLYGISGAGAIRRLPFLKIILFLISIIYILRGTVVFLIPFPEITLRLMALYPNLLGMGRHIMFHDWIFSFVWLVIGIIYFVGWWKLPLKEGT